MTFNSFCIAVFDCKQLQAYSSSFFPSGGASTLGFSCSKHYFMIAFRPFTYENRVLFLQLKRNKQLRLKAQLQLFFAAELQITVTKLVVHRFASCRNLGLLDVSYLCKSCPICALLLIAIENIALWYGSQLPSPQKLIVLQKNK